MSKIVFVLGAGASHHCETPLMDNFLEVAEDLMRMGEVDEVMEDFKRVFDAVGNLHAIQSKAKINTYNIEDVYAAFEMGKLLGSLPGIENHDIAQLTSSIRKVIGYTLEQTTRLPNSANTQYAPESYYRFAGIIESLINEKRDCSILTFNYDLGLDFSLYARRILPNYGLGDIDATNKKYVTFLKLHGSLNWGKCKECGGITPYRELKTTLYTSGKNYSTLPIISRLKGQKCSHCGGPLEEDPFIVPPTWNKTAFHDQIDKVWKTAAHELRDAEHVFVLGYSFPTTDMFFRYLFALGVDMGTILRGFYVYNTDPAVKERFEGLLGSGVSIKFQYYKLKFEHAIQKVLTGYADYMDINTRYLTIPQILHIS